MNKIIKFENTMSVRAFAQERGIKSFKLQPYTNKEGVENIGAVFSVGDESVWIPLSQSIKEIAKTATADDVRISMVTHEDGAQHLFVHGTGSTGNELL
jgi:hypothetical protein